MLQNMSCIFRTRKYFRKNCSNGWMRSEGMQRFYPCRRCRLERKFCCIQSKNHESISGNILLKIPILFTGISRTVRCIYRCGLCLLRNRWLDRRKHLSMPCQYCAAARYIERSEMQLPHIQHALRLYRRFLLQNVQNWSYDCTHVQLGVFFVFDQINDLSVSGPRKGRFIQRVGIPLDKAQPASQQRVLGCGQ